MQEKMTIWRYRLCPACGMVSAAGDFICLDYGSNWNKRGEARRRCPNCGIIGATNDFPVQVKPKAPPIPVHTEPLDNPWWDR